MLLFCISSISVFKADDFIFMKHIGRSTIILLFSFAILIFFIINITSAHEQDLCDTMYKHKSMNSYLLPVEGEWLVYWGGCKKTDNSHHQTADQQRFAYDLVKTNEHGRFFKGKGKRLTDYYAYGQNILAPEDGIVVSAIDGIEDYIIPNPNFIPGNLLVIKHHGNEYSYLAHLQRNSILVKVGDAVKKGQLVAKCGNSGNSTMPHLHFHITDNPNFHEGIGLPIQFSKIVVDEEPRIKYSPHKSERVINP